VIRYKNVRGTALDAAVETLLKEVDARPSTKGARKSSGGLSLVSQYVPSSSRIDVGVFPHTRHILVALAFRVTMEFIAASRPVF
jgi:hypothetical protein